MTHTAEIQATVRHGNWSCRGLLYLWMISDFPDFLFVLLHLFINDDGQDDRRIQMQINLAAIDSLSFSLFMGAAVE